MGYCELFLFSYMTCLVYLPARQAHSEPHPAFQPTRKTIQSSKLLLSANCMPNFQSYYMPDLPIKSSTVVV